MMELVNSVMTEQTKILLIIFLCIFMLEMLSGTIGAIMRGEFKSKIFRKGLYGKSGYFIQLILVFLLAMMVQMPYLFYADILWISASEGTSVLENLEKMACPIPSFIKNILATTKKTAEDTVNKNDSEE